MDTVKIKEKQNVAVTFSLESLLKLSEMLNSSTGIDYILNSALLSVMGKLRMPRGAVYLNSPENRHVFKPEIMKGNAAEMTFAASENLISQPYYILYDGGEKNKFFKFQNGDPEYFSFAFTLQHEDIIYGFILLGSGNGYTPLSKQELQYSVLICRIAITAMLNAMNIASLNSAKANLERQNQLLRTLFEISTNFSTLHDRDLILKIFSFHLMGQLMISSFAIYTKDAYDNYSPILNRFNAELGSTALKEIFDLEEPALFRNCNFSPATVADVNTVRAKMFVPITINGKRIGVLITGKKQNGEDFTPFNVNFAGSLATSAVAALENEEKNRIESELSLSRNIHKNLLPKETPHLGADWSLAGNSIPSRLVGGDYFDYIKVGKGRYLVCIADVCGHGIAASLLSANIQAALRVLAPIISDLKTLILRINSLVCENTPSDKFITFFAGILDTNDSTFRYINAGHNPPLLLRRNSGKFDELDAGGLILGIFSNSTKSDYSEGLATMLPGDVLCLYTDGITESGTESGEEFGIDRLKNHILQNINKAAGEILNEIFASVDKYTAGSGEKYDDLTAVIIKCNENKADKKS